MKIVHLSTYDTGGAAKACIRLHVALLKKGIDSKLITFAKTQDNIPEHYVFKDERRSFFYRIINRFKISYFYRKRAKILSNRPLEYELFSLHTSPVNILRNKFVQQADIINLHWIPEFVDYATFFKSVDKNIVWTLHDMNPFTGGCHYSSNCFKYNSNCMNCKQLKGTKDNNLSNKILLSKEKIFSNDIKLNIVAPSKWLNNLSRESKLFSIYKNVLIPYSLDSKIFHPISKFNAREILNLPKAKKIILFVSDSIINKRKGFPLLIDALKKYNNSDVLLCSVGSTNKSSDLQNYFHLGKIHDERLMSIIYSAADVFVIPSLEDNLPNTVIESLMCGTPVIGFNIGGIPDMVENNVDGVLCEKQDADSLLKGIITFFDNQDSFDRNKIREKAVKKYDESIQADNYIALYKSILKID